MTTSVTTRSLTTDGPREIELGAPGPGEVRIAIAAAAVNPADVATRAGLFHQFGLIPEGVVAGLGWDLAGTVDAVGEGVDDLEPGDAVIGLRDDPAAPAGSHGEAVVLPRRAVGRAPEGLEPTAAATIALNALTAKQALDLLDLPAGATLLVTGAHGAVGGFAVELGRLRGLEVTGVGRGDALPSEVDGALDPAQLGDGALAAVRDGGAFVSVLDPATPAPARDIRVAKVSVHAEPGELDALARLAEQGELSLPVAGVVPFADADAAYDRVAAGGLRGRVVLRMG